MQRFPLLPVEEEGRLHDMPLRENFIERVFADHRWRQFLAPITVSPRPGGVSHAAQNSPCSPIVASIIKRSAGWWQRRVITPWHELVTEYGRLLMTFLPLSFMPPGKSMPMSCLICRGT